MTQHEMMDVISHVNQGGGIPQWLAEKLLAWMQRALENSLTDADSKKYPQVEHDDGPDGGVFVHAGEIRESHPMRKLG